MWSSISRECKISINSLNKSIRVVFFCSTVSSIPLHQSITIRFAKEELSYLSDKSLKVRMVFEREFMVIFPGQKGKIKVQSNGKSVKCLQKDVPVPEVIFIASPHKTYIVSI